MRQMVSFYCSLAVATISDPNDPNFAAADAERLADSLKRRYQDDSDQPGMTASARTIEIELRRIAEEIRKETSRDQVILRSLIKSEQEARLRATNLLN